MNESFKELLSRAKEVYDETGIFRFEDLEYIIGMMENSVEGVSSECNTVLCESASSQQTVQNAEGQAVEILKELIPDDYDGLIKVCSKTHTINLSEIDSGLIIRAIQILKSIK